MEEKDLSTKEIVRNYVSKDKEGGRHKARPGVYHASNIWQCFRKMFYERKEAKGKEKPYGLFEMGRAVEEKLEAALIDHYGSANILNDIPVCLARTDEGLNPIDRRLAEGTKYIVVGRTDPVVVRDNLAVYRLYECKSSKAGARTNTKDAHKHQLSTYAKALKPEEALIVHPDRNDLLNMPDEETVLDDAEVEELHKESMEWLDLFHEYVEKDDLPPAQPMVDSDCTWCSFKEICRRDGGWKPYGRGMTRIEKALTDGV